MPRPIITEDLVKSTADAMLAEGVDPSIMAVQARIGGGSYTTVKRYLDIWRSNRATGDGAAMDLPPEVEAKGKEFVLATWTVAKQLAHKEAQVAKEVAAAEVATIRNEIAQALQEIARLEASEAQRIELIGQQVTQLRELELALADAHAQVRRTDDLEKTLNATRQELSAAQKEATTRAVESGRMAGEVDALRTQVAGLMEALKSMGKGKN
ncbi:MAG: DNA-binding protein [Fibrobacterota bacterium]|nr:DNA-binding protein [Fibrobacterota bacterium]